MPCDCTLIKTCRDKRCSAEQYSGWRRTVQTEQPDTREMELPLLCAFQLCATTWPRAHRQTNRLKLILVPSVNFNTSGLTVCTGKTCRGEITKNKMFNLNRTNMILTFLTITWRALFLIITCVEKVLHKDKQESRSLCERSQVTYMCVCNYA